MERDKRTVTGSGQYGNEQEKPPCDWCGQKEAQGVFFVPGNGVINLCEDCRMLLMAVLID